MCSDECQDSDILHLEAMMQSGCDCLELSPTPDEEHYTVEGEFCLKNSGRLLCDTLERCGVWDCRPGDFMCPRHESPKRRRRPFFRWARAVDAVRRYNKQWTRFRGFGDCSAGRRGAAPGRAACAAALAAVLLLRPRR